MEAMISNRKQAKVVLCDKKAWGVRTARVRGFQEKLKQEKGTTRVVPPAKLVSLLEQQYSLVFGLWPSERSLTEVRYFYCGSASLQDDSKAYFQKR